MSGHDGSLPPDGEPSDDLHDGCWGIHLGPDGEHHDCDGQPI